MPNIDVGVCLSLGERCEEAAEFYVAIFPGSRIVSRSRYGEAGREMHQQRPGTILAVEFDLSGRRFMALNGPKDRFNQAISLQIHCDTQEEVDHFWERLTAGGKPIACGWLEDRYGVSWQVVPRVMGDMLSDFTSPASQRAFVAMMGMVKIDIAAIKRAYAGA
ncbi:MAG: VOC family protein [Phycisphaerales bacterium]|nr:VOC family protein [Phycisphaerales bacterium]